MSNSASNSTRSERYAALDSLKFLFSVVIVFFHVLYSNIKPYIGNTELFREFAQNTQYCGLIVECFLVIAGYFIYHTWKRGKTSFPAFIESRWIRLWPVFAFYVLILALLTKFRIEDMMTDLCFLRCSGLAPAYKGIVWYIGPFFWSSLLVYAVLKNLDKGKALLILSIMAYLCYAVNINIYNGGLGREVKLEFLSTGMLRVCGGLCIGALLGALKDAFRNAEPPSTKSTHWHFALISLIEMTSLGLLGYHFLADKLFGNGFISVILFSILFLCLVSSGGVISRLLSWRPLAYMGRYCYSIYVMQQVAFTGMARAYWKSHTELMQQHPGWSIALSTGIAVLIGIGTYYLVEAPAVTLWKKIKSSKKQLV